MVPIDMSQHDCPHKRNCMVDKNSYKLVEGHLLQFWCRDILWRQAEANL